MNMKNIVKLTFLTLLFSCQSDVFPDDIQVYESNRISSFEAYTDELKKYDQKFNFTISKDCFNNVSSVNESFFEKDTKGIYENIYGVLLWSSNICPEDSSYIYLAFNRSSQKGNLFSKINIAKLYIFNGRYFEAERLLFENEGKHPLFDLLIVELIENGDISDKNNKKEKMLKLLRKHINSAYSDEAAHKLGRELIKSKQDEIRNKGYNYLLDSANSGYPPAQYTLAVNEYDKKNRDIDIVLSWLKKSHTSGYDRATFLLARIYISQNEVAKGIKLLDSLIDYQFGPAYVLLSQIYRDDKFGLEDKGMSFQLLKDASLFYENPALQFNLGAYYATGSGTTVNAEKAKYWLNRAWEKHGHEKSRVLLEKIKKADND